LTISFYRNFFSYYFCFIAPSTTNVIRQGSKALPTFDDRSNANKSTSDNNRFGSKGGSGIDKEQIVNIDTLNPYMNKLIFDFIFLFNKKSKNLDGQSKLV
jgi:ribosomal protein L16 Arg81 hydroxylase